MKRFTNLGLAAALAGLLCLPVLAQQAQVQTDRADVRVGQDNDTTPNNNLDRNTNRPVDRTIDPNNRATVNRDTARQQLPPLRVSELTGMEVRNYENEDLGNIDDLVVDPQSGQIRYAAVSMGGFLGIGDSLFAVPWKAITLRTNDDGDYFAYVDINKQRMENAEGFDKDNWPNFGDERWLRENDRRFRIEVDTRDNDRVIRPNVDRGIDRNRQVPADRNNNLRDRNTTPEVETDRRNTTPRVEVEVDRDNR